MELLGNLPNVTLLTTHDWQRLRNIRLRALKTNPEAFGPKFEEELVQTKDKWLERFAKEDYLISSIEHVDVGMLYIEVLNGDHGTTCWIGGCWTDPIYRGKGVMKSLFTYIDNNCKRKGWQRQGLGVWTHNLAAIKSYESLGFIVAGEQMPSTTYPGQYFQHMVRNCGSLLNQ
jgi:GNAT superfamily N-acetyltransferase